MRGTTRRLDLAALLTAVVLATAACGGGGDPGTGTDPSSTPTSDPEPAAASPTTSPSYDWSNRPSPVVLLLPDEQVELRAWTSCWSGPPDADGGASAACYDGAPGLAGEIPDVGSPETVDFWFGMPGWEFGAAFFRPEGGESGKPVGEPVVERTGKQTFRLTGIDEPGEYRVDLNGQGEQGDVNVSFRWTIAH